MSRRLAGLLAAFALLSAACGGGGEDSGVPAAGSTTLAGEQLTGLLTIAPGECSDGGVESGSWFRMVQSGGSPDEGPYVGNADSPCGDDTWMPLTPGDDGGLLTGDYQPLPEPAFDDQGNARGAGITAPATWFAVDFATSTNPVDPQTSAEVPPPTVTVDRGKLSGDLRGFAASWNGQHFNQGSPKPDGSTPGATALPTGSYDPDSGAYTLEWTSHIRGGPFDGFTGVWHLEGTFQPAG